MNPDFWLYKEHAGKIRILEMTEKDFRETIARRNHLQLYNPASKIDSVFYWDEVKPSYSFFFDYQDNDAEIKTLLENSDLSRHQKMYLETHSGEPIIEVEVKYFIDNWLEFVDSNHGQGSVMCTTDYSLFFEFTNDEDYLLCSNFIIKV